ncbi:MAG TPA: HEAT repeat domain-containing protein, partial [Gemmatimonadales bacterium]|nr:HEAT repeat domain-containing protein [Gemmatimonadales bacterium]
MSCSNPRQTRFVSSVAAFLIVAAARPAAAQVQADETTIGVLAALLAASDARRFDAAPLREALSHSNPAVRRQGALAAGRMGDAAAVDFLLPALNDSSPYVQAGAAFALGVLKDARAIPALLVSAREGQVEAVTAIAKIGGDEGARALSEIIASGTPEASAPVVDQALLEAWRLAGRAPVSQLVRFADARSTTTRWRALYSL